MDTASAPAHWCKAQWLTWWDLRPVQSGAQWTQGMETVPPQPADHEARARRRSAATTSGQVEIAVRHQLRASITANGGAIGTLAGGWTGANGVPAAVSEMRRLVPASASKVPRYDAPRCPQTWPCIVSWSPRGQTRRCGAGLLPPSVFAPLRGSNPEMPPATVFVGLQWASLARGNNFAPGTR